MPLEIERKFLCSLTREEAFALAFKNRTVKSIYLESTVISSVRVVKDTYSVNDVVCKATEKRSTENAMSRVEIETNIPVQVFNALDTGTYPSVSKTRFVINHNNNFWEVDFYDDYEFVTAELEFECIHKATNFTDFPSWIIKEITDDPSYLNCNLAK